MNETQLAEDLGLKTEAARRALSVMLLNLKLLDDKQLDYGPHNISAFGEFGVLVRCSDKVERLKHLQKKGNPIHEGIHDSWQDLANYAVIAQLVHQNLWPNE
jgi:hypothetical protein